MPHGSLCVRHRLQETGSSWLHSGPLASTPPPPLCSPHSPPPHINQLNVIVYQGSKRSREVLRHYEWANLHFSVVLITYEILEKDISLLQPKNWKLLVADEAHKK